MWKKISNSPEALSLLAGLACVLAFPPIRITSVLVLTPWLLILAINQAKSKTQAFRVGFITSLAIMGGGFYWVVYVLHVFGDLPWIVAGILYLIFSGFGAINFPLFSWSIYQLQNKFPALKKNASWYCIGIPGVFIFFEYWAPKLFPWYVGHAYFESLWLNQVVELTGSTFLSFLIFSWGGAIVSTRVFPRSRLQMIAVPLCLTLFSVAFSAWRNTAEVLPGRTKRVALIQPNIGSLDKLQAQLGSKNKLHYTIDRYLSLSEQAVSGENKPDLLLWPETAMPFSLFPESNYAQPIRQAVLRWGVPLISGGYAPPEGPPYAEYNAAFLLEPGTGGEIQTSVYYKNILLAFGEYFPGGEYYPQVYDWAPQVSHFKSGTDQRLFTLADGTRLGVTICYEDISPAFFRKVASQGVHAIVNLTNDSWFGPTSEPYQHGALSVFRAIETRTPFVRVTNTGISFAVDRLGRMSKTTPVYDEGVLSLDISLPQNPALTLYIRFGEWFLWLVTLCILAIIARAHYVPLRS